MFGGPPPSPLIGILCESPWHPRFIHPPLELVVLLGCCAYSAVLFLKLPFFNLIWADILEKFNFSAMAGSSPKAGPTSWASEPYAVPGSQQMPKER